MLPNGRGGRFEFDYFSLKRKGRQSVLMKIRKNDSLSQRSELGLGLFFFIPSVLVLWSDTAREIGKTYYGKEVRTDDKEMECAC